MSVQTPDLRDIRPSRIDRQVLDRAGLRQPFDALSREASFTPEIKPVTKRVHCGVCGYLSHDVVNGRCGECADVFVTPTAL